MRSGVIDDRYMIYRPRSHDSARAGGGALPVIVSIIRSSAKPTTTRNYNL